MWVQKQCREPVRWNAWQRCCILDRADCCDFRFCRSLYDLQILYFKRLWNKRVCIHHPLKVLWKWESRFIQSYARLGIRLWHLFAMPWFTCIQRVTRCMMLDGCLMKWFIKIQHLGIHWLVVSLSINFLTKLFTCSLESTIPSYNLMNTFLKNHQTWIF